MKLISLNDPSITPVSPANRTRPAGLPLLSVGERVEALVLEVREKGLLLLDIGGNTVLAESKQPLGEGARFTARVVRNSPQIVLQVLAGDAPAGQESIPESLGMFRSRPGLLGDMFRQLSTLVESLADTLPGDLPPQLAAARSSLQGLLSALVFPGSGKPSSSTGAGEAPAGLPAPADGEGNPAVRLPDGENAPEKAAPATLRESLVRLAEAAEREMAAMDAGAPGRKSLEQAASTARSALETLDVHRDVNILSRREGGPFVLQVPAAFPGGIRVQDLFLYPEGGQEGGGEDGKEAFRMVLCLNMEALGDILVDARLAGGRMSGTLRCGTEEVREYLQSGLDELRERLAASGFPDAGIVCLADHDIARTILDRKQSLPIFQRDAVNLYA